MVHGYVFELPLYVKSMEKLENNQTWFELPDCHFIMWTLIGQIRIISKVYLFRFLRIFIIEFVDILYILFADLFWFLWHAPRCIYEYVDIFKSFAYVIFQIVDDSIEY